MTDTASTQRIAAYHLGLMSNEVKIVRTEKDVAVEYLSEGVWCHYLSAPTEERLVQILVDRTEL